jgi:G6PDH family F420-dependent oxidoreductase
MSDDGPSLRLGWWLSSEEHDPRALVLQAIEAEAAGLHTVMISDHLQPWVRHQGHSPHVWTVIGAIAQATRDLEVGTGVVGLGHRNHPISVAQAAATAAVMLEGRFFLGVGMGERLNEQPFGQRWPSAAERRSAAVEAIEVIRELWSGDLVDHRGERWNVEGLRLPTLPAAPPPIYVAASGGVSAETAGEHADGLIAVAPDPHLVDVFRGSGGARKRCVAQVHVSLAATEEAALANAWEWWPNGAVPSRVLGQLSRPEDFEAIARGMQPDDVRNTVTIATGAEPVVRAIDRYVAAGYDTVYLHHVGPDQGRLADLVRTELVAHYGAA